MQPTLKTSRPRLYWREWQRVRPAAYAKYSNYIVVPTNTPADTYTAGRTPADGYERFFTPHHAAQAVIGRATLRDLVERDYLYPDASYFEGLRGADWDQSVLAFRQGLEGADLRQFTQDLIRAVAYKHNLHIAQDAAGWWRVYLPGVLGYAGETLRDALLEAYANANGATYLLALPCYTIQRTDTPDAPHIGQVRSEGKAFGFILRSPKAS